MKALIQKDLRENLKVALIGLLVFSLLLMQAYQSCNTALANILRGSWSGQVNALQPLLSMQLLAESAFFCALFGAALGWLQTRNEAHRDLWAYLIHRPVTRTDIFWGKTIAGLCLYAFGAGVPLLVLVTVVRLPGHVAAPFEWDMVVPVALIFLTGLAYYFAGLLTGLRQARWFVSRSFGLAPALFASASVFTAAEFWEAAILILIMIVIVALATRGAYQTGGWHRGQPVIGKVALITAVTAGCTVVLFAGLGLVIALIIDPLTHSAPSSLYSNFQMTREGVIYKVTTRDNDTVAIVDLDGHPLIDRKTDRPMERIEFNKHSAYGAAAFSSFKIRPRQNIIEDASHYFCLVSVTDKTLWYLDRRGKLAGYDGWTRKYIGSLAAPGTNGTAASEPFLPQASGYNYNYYNAYSEHSQRLMVSARAVYHVDFKDRTVSPIFTVTSDDEIGACSDEEAVYDDNQPKKFLITTRKTVQLLDSDGRTVFAVPYQPGFAGYPQIQVSFLKATNDFAVWFHPDYELNRLAHYTMPTYVKWIGQDSTIAKSVELPNLQQSWTQSWTDKLMTSLLPPPVQVKFNDETDRTWKLFGFALAAVCAVISWILVRRHNYSTKASVGWAIFVLLLGIPGLLALLCVQEWPVREACPGCQKPRAVDRENCEHCAATFLPPQKNGTEIFAPLSKA